MRWNNGNGYNNSTVFSNAIKKYGWDNFEHVIIAENLSNQAADELEIKLIAEYNSTDRRFGYNVALGGKTGGPNHNSQGVIQYSMDGIEVQRFPSYRAAAFEIDRHPSNIKNACTGKGGQRICGDFFWSRVEEPLTLQEIQNFKLEKMIKRRAGFDSMAKILSIAVVEIDLATGLVINEYSSQREAAESRSDLSTTNVCDQCKKTRITANYKRPTIFQLKETYKSSSFYKGEDKEPT